MECLEIGKAPFQIQPARAASIRVYVGRFQYGFHGASCNRAPPVIGINELRPECGLAATDTDRAEGAFALILDALGIETIVIRLFVADRRCREEKWNQAFLELSGDGLGYADAAALGAFKRVRDDVADLVEPKQESTARIDQSVEPDFGAVHLSGVDIGRIGLPPRVLDNFSDPEYPPWVVTLLEQVYAVAGLSSSMG